MRKVIVVAFREYQAAVKTKAFIVSLVLMPIMMGGSFFAQRLLKDQVDTTEKRVAVVDFTGEFADTLIAKSQERNEKKIYIDVSGGQKQVKPKFVVQQIVPQSDNLEELSLALSDRTRNGDLLAYVIIEKDALNPEATEKFNSIAYHSNSPTYDDVLNWMETVLNDRAREVRLRGAGMDPERVASLTKWTDVVHLGLVSRDVVTGDIKPAEKTNRVASFILPMILMMFMFIVVMVGASPLMQSVLEEKTNRIAEVLLGSVPPFQLMLGKLIGMVGVSLTIVTIYLVGAFYAMNSAGVGQFFPRDLIWWFVVYQVLAILLFGSLFVAIGAAVNDMREAQSMMTPVMLLVVAPMFVWFNVIKEPLSTFSTVASFFPPATPMLMTLRQAVPPGIPTWQPVLGVVLVLLTTIACVFAAGRIFRVGILMQGQGAKFSQMIQWVFRG